MVYKGYLLVQRFCFVLKFALQRQGGGIANCKTKDTEPLTQEIFSALYILLNFTPGHH